MGEYKSTQKAYVKSINKALFFIEDNLDLELTLSEVAVQANYSPFHFHRIFKTITNETLTAYINRKRVEKAAALLIHQKNTSIADIYIRTGFNSNASFSRSFKQYYGVSPTTFRASSPGKFSKINHQNSKNRQANNIFEAYICNIENQLNWINRNTNITVKTLAERHVAFITHLGEAGLNRTFQKLIKWATPKGFFDEANSKLGTIYHDSFKITANDKVRMSAFIMIEDKIKADDIISITNIQAGKYIVGKFEIKIDEFEKAWSSLFIWMNAAGYKMSTANAFEVYHNDFTKHPQGKAVVDFHIPIL